MKVGSFDSLVRALDEAAVRYLIAGGLAVNAHGYLRFTRDVDLVLQLGRENILSAFEALDRIGYPAAGARQRHRLCQRSETRGVDPR